MNAIPIHTTPTGEWGTAERVPVEKHPATVVAWIINMPHAHPFWKQWSLSVVRLTDIEGYPPANKQFPEATHELMIVALNPEGGLVNAKDVGSGKQKLNYLTPINVAEQFVASDEAAETVAWLAVWSCLTGKMSAEPPLGYESFREEWSRAVHASLDHFKDPNHGALN